MKQVKNISLYMQVVFILLFTTILFIFLNMYETQKQRDTLRMDVKNYKGAIEKELELNIHTLYAIEALFRVQRTVSEKDFKVFRQTILKNHPSVETLEWVPKMMQEQSHEYESLLKTLLQAENLEMKFTDSNISLVQIKDKKDGLSVFLLLKNELQNHYGIILGVLQLKHLIDTALKNYNLLETKIQLDDVGDENIVLYNGSIDKDAFVCSELLHYSGRVWRVSVSIESEYLSVHHYMANSILVYGFLLILFVWYRDGKIKERENDFHRLNDALKEKYDFILKELEDHKHAVDEHSIVVKTDSLGVISYVNTKFTDTSGYSEDELIGENQRIVDSKTHSKSFWQEMYGALKSRNIWHGEICNMTKEGSKFWLETTIVGILDEKEKLKSYIAISTDITNIKETERNIRKKDRLLLEQSRLAQMGELISMIAHQWRQPLGAISATNIDLKMKMELDIYDLSAKNDREVCKDYFIKGLDLIEQLTMNLTMTIDDFKDFYKPNRIRNTIGINQVIEKVKVIIDTSYKEDNIIIEEECLSQKKIRMLDGEVMQVLLNIFKNAQDNFKSRNTKNRCVKIITNDVDNGILISVSDNGGGINGDIMDKIFDPYFSTKNIKNGTGLGLYMSKVIVEDHHWGSLDAQNIENGVVFSIILKEEES